MQDAILKFEQLLNENVNYILTINNEILEVKNPGKWSKKEILGHLVDSALHNCFVLRRLIMRKNHIVTDHTIKWI
ncbi:hypothetical protein D3C86_437860 [compost metagenome]